VLVAACKRRGAGHSGGGAFWTVTEGDRTCFLRVRVDGPEQTGQANTYAVEFSVDPVDEKFDIYPGPGSLMLSVDDDKAYFEPGELRYFYDFTNWSGDGQAPTQTEGVHHPPAPADDNSTEQAKRMTMEWVLGKVPVVGDAYAFAMIGDTLMGNRLSASDYVLVSDLNFAYHRAGDAMFDDYVGPDAVFTDDRFFDIHTVAWDSLRGSVTHANYLAKLRYTFGLVRTDPARTVLYVRAMMPYYWQPNPIWSGNKRFFEIEWGIWLPGPDDGGGADDGEDGDGTGGDIAIDAHSNATLTDQMNHALVSGWNWSTDGWDYRDFTDNTVRIYTRRGDVWSHFNDLHDMLTRAAPSGDFTLQTRLSFDPSKFNQQAGLIVYADDDNYVTLRRGHVGVRGVGNEIVWLICEKDGELEYKAIAVEATQVDLTLVKVGGTYTGYAAPSGSAAQLVGTFTGVTLTPARVGVCATDGDYDPTTRLPADFDWFKILQ